jgi:methylmalonyl-CoA/ethylmalonyl-CoA epimerase
LTEKPRVHHLAILVENLDAARTFWEKGLGLTIESIETVPDQEVKVAFLPTDNLEIELVVPINQESKLAKVLAKRGQGMHHVCLEVDQLDEKLKHLAQLGVRLIHPEPIPGADGRRMAFIHPKSTAGVLVELYERQTE